MLARQLKLRLMADEGSDIPRSCSNVVVSIHAIATFQAFNDYLRPRILAATAVADRAGGSEAAGGSGRLSGFLAAFAAAADEEAGGATASGSDQRLSSSLGTTEIATSTQTSPEDGKAKRRRSSRLNPEDASTSTPDAKKAELSAVEQASVLLFSSYRISY